MSSLKGLDASQVLTKLKLWVGPWPQRKVIKADATLLVLCAKELIPRPIRREAQHPSVRRDVEPGRPPPDPASSLTGEGVRVHRCPLRDTPNGVDLGLAAAAQGAALAVARELQAGGRVLVCCRRGLNRGPFICCLALMMLRPISADDAVEILRDARGEDALSNPALVEFLRRCAFPHDEELAGDAQK